MSDISMLSKQETKVLNSLSTGLLYKEIADTNHISINTVKKHLKNVYRKLQVSKRTQAIEKYLAAVNPIVEKEQVLEVA